ncbi:MAG: hypothetical protein HY532_02420 [Chloroflexi bacterium]|nr:hypothetical protein [Chloroflexota bacterium]
MSSHARALLLTVGVLATVACGAPASTPSDSTPSLAAGQAETPSPAAPAGEDAAQPTPSEAEAAPTPSPLPPTGSKVGERAPDFILTLDSGQSASLASLREDGRPVVLYFFTTW